MPDVSRKISIITPSYNQGEFLAATIESVISQTGNFSIDYLIMDGGSTDNSVEIIREYESLLQRRAWPVTCNSITFRWYSRKDNGQADAVNNGFDLATGDFLGWLNSDDTYLPGAFTRIIEYFIDRPDIVMVYGNAWYTDRYGDILSRYGSEPFSLKRLAVRSIICQPTVFLRKEALQMVGKLDTNLQTCLDYDLWIRLGQTYEKRITFLDDYLATSRMYAENKTVSMRDHIYRETILVARKHFGYVPGVWIVHSILEKIQAPGIPSLGKARTVTGQLLFLFRFLLQPKTLVSTIWFLITRLMKHRNYASNNRK